MDETPKAGAPAWMVSFGDMMTLILTFFILLVSMSKEQQEGLVATGVGSFLVALRSYGLPGILSDAEEAAVFESVRRRFNLPPEDDPERRTEKHKDASQLEEIRAKIVRSLRPHDELNQPGIATFAHGSEELGEASRRYLDTLAPSLRPGADQILLLEGHAGPAEAGGDARWLAFARARAVADYLIERHGFLPVSVEPRAWVSEIETNEAAMRVVDARLVIPARDE